MDLVQKILVDRCNLAAEYYMFALNTFGEKFVLTKKFKKQFIQILKDIREIYPDFEHRNPEESIIIDYKIFQLDVDIIMRKNINDMTGIEMNTILHHIAGGTIELCDFYDFWTPTNRKIFLCDYGYHYLVARRSLLIADILL
jgi:hypothetical protein